MSLCAHYGNLTFEAEGHEGGPYHSRKFHVPTASSGLTIGRGYDMATKAKGKIYNDLLRIGVEKTIAEKISEAALQRGANAKAVVQQHKLESFEISKEQQLKLFAISLGEESAVVQRICEQPSAKERLLYGACSWANLNSAIKEVLIDLKFRGDYTIDTRKKIQKHVASNNLNGFYEVMSDVSYWTKDKMFPVSPDRFKRRVDFLRRNLQCH